MKQEFSEMNRGRRERDLAKRVARSRLRQHYFGLRMRVWNYYRYLHAILLLGTVFLGANIVRKTTRHGMRQVDATPRQRPPGLPLPKYMVVALHSNVNVFPDIIMQVLPQLTKEWTVWFVAANKPGAPPKNWTECTRRKLMESSHQLHTVSPSVQLKQKRQGKT